MSYSVAKLAPELIVPSEATPTGNLPLSFMDRLPTMRFMVESIHVYSHGEEPAELIRGALSKALVPYFPMAGRFAMSGGELEVACTGEGIWFVEATADFSLEDVNNLQLPLAVPKEDILPYFPPEDIKDVIMLIQVTQFKCGGFVVGIRSDHAMGGGAGFGAFMQTVAYMARGRAAPSVMPAWGRAAIPNPAKPILMGGPPPVFTPMDLQKLAVDIPLDHINQLQSEYAKETGERCSTFDVVIAKVWQCRAQAIGLHPDADVRVAFAASTVHLLKDVLPEGFYGNCGYPLTVSAPSGKLMNASLVEVVGMIREAKNSLGTVFSKWMAGDPEADPFRAPPDYGLLAVSDWSKVGFHELDYGWGEPIHVAPIVDDSPFMATCFFLKPPAPEQGVRLLTSCVVREHFGVFHEMMTKLE
ncbi:3'-N-debenzoyl-2'-deoxytaxol N-benzoyltransferase [Musa troglodytarum]|uniref:3'-N-debenzoyl-2'-deoxytaxol N-benzoyltransferase n=1 Tax=Musa troglodytarum TaxID=320322 RepID=A0A9E7F0G6_9LILI|nr:3'-N-debenzoyl-2'-deoxytaxol N-benzoyltransferase [Musa troglodytarum]